MKKPYIFIAVGIALVIGIYVLVLSSSFNYRFYRELETQLAKVEGQKMIDLAQLTNFEWDEVAIVRTDELKSPSKGAVLGILRDKVASSALKTLKLNTTYFFFYTSDKQIIQRSINNASREYLIYYDGCYNDWLSKDQATLFIKSGRKKYLQPIQLKANCIISGNIR